MSIWCDIFQEDKVQEKQIVDIFSRFHLINFSDLIKSEYPVRVYSFGIPVITDDGIKYPDLVLEDNNEKMSPMYRQMYVLEFKSGKQDYQSACSQVLRYAKFLKRQLYRKKDIISYIIAPCFSNFEIEFCKENKVISVKYDPNTGMMELTS